MINDRKYNRNALSPLVIVGVACGLGLFATTIDPTTALGIFAILFGLAVIIASSKGSRAITAILLVAFFLRVGVAVADTYVARVPGSGDDSARFETLAEELSASSLADLIPQFRTGSTLIVWIAAVLYSLFGTSAFLIKVLLALLGTLTVYNVYRIAQELWYPAAATRAGWIAAVYPTHVLFSGVFLRESPVAFLTSLGAYHAVLAFRGRGIQHIVLSIVAFAVATAFHTGVAAALVGLAIASLVGSMQARRRNRRSPRLRNFGVVLLVVISFAAISITGWGLDKLGSTAQSISFEDVALIQQSAARGDAAYLDGLTISSTTDVVWQAPIRLAYFLLAPFVWMVTTPAHVLGLLDAGLISLMLLAAFRVRRQIVNNTSRRVILVLFTTTALAFSLGTSNFGTAIRHRAKVTPLLITLVVAFPWERAARVRLQNGQPSPGIKTSWQIAQIGHPNLSVLRTATCREAQHK